jgi:hypothetical protein
VNCIIFSVSLAIITAVLAVTEIQCYTFCVVMVWAETEYVTCNTVLKYLLLATHCTHDVDYIE